MCVFLQHYSEVGDQDSTLGARKQPTAWPGHSLLSWVSQYAIQCVSMHTHTHRSSFPNSPDDDKICHRPRSASHTPSHPPSTHSPTQSPGHTLTPPHPHTPTSTNHNSHTSSQRSPFNRRKWLQPSDPGLIFGTPPPSHPHSSPPHGSPTHYQSDTRSPLLQSTGQAIARQLSDSGSSNEGEDPTSLSRRTYINSGREGPQSGEDGLVGSTLSAIQNGRIKTDSTATGKTQYYLSIVAPSVSPLT